jgi:capsular polysaccharide export protein
MTLTLLTPPHIASAARTADTGPRTVLLLQGPPTRFWSGLGARFRANGHRVLHVGFSLADRLNWRGPGATWYRGPLADWGDWLAAFCAREGVTDLLYYADRLPYHRTALSVARARGMRAWSIENGYLRPDWLTLEPEAMGAFSRFSRDGAVIRALAAQAEPPDMTPRYRHGFAREAVAEVAYNLTMSLGRPLFPHYASDRPYMPALDYLSWLRRWAFGRRAVRTARVADAACRRRDWPWVLCALQLQSDYQIRCSSRYGSLAQMIDEVLISFARKAPADLRLIFKLHPLDNGWCDFPRLIRQRARALGVEARILAADGGDLDTMLSGARGVVTVNSTVGLHALQRGTPLIALGDAVYDLPGLTHQGGLDAFWTAPEPVDAGLAADFVTALAATIQVRGSFHNPAGQQVAAGEIVRRVEQADRYWQVWRPLDALGP